MEYYIKINDEKRGPYSLNELAERKLETTTLVMPIDGVEWIPANQIDELRPLLETNALTKNEAEIEDIPLVEATPVTQATPQESIQQQQNQPIERKKSYTGCLIGILIALIALVSVMIITCPKTEQHKEVLSTVITNTLNNEINENENLTGNTLIDNSFKTISNAFAGKVIKAVIDNLIVVDNHIVYSLGKIHYEGKDHIVSIGVFGHIFTVGEDDLKEVMEQYYKKEEINMKEQLLKKAQDVLQDNVIEPATSAVQGLLENTINGVLDEIGLKPQSSNSNKDEYIDSDSI